ncbi:TonB-dependent siderophore receptor [Salinisphaera sp. Q1T1-3]|uniref:TonB-dependent siderophore receptor n=1 Tax=Salinisphaera sp. Q1T1-3 TaxID=2321229 RepID=UPI000E73F7B5|nr:TonB-dependent siderophore receptor [Salinisphaera sp. Q1T1-3]
MRSRANRVAVISVSVGMAMMTAPPLVAAPYQTPEPEDDSGTSVAPDSSAKSGHPRSSEAKRPPSKSSSQKPASVEPAAAVDSTLSTIDVFGFLDDLGYNPGFSSGAYGMGMPLQETPRAVDVIGRDVLDDQQSTDVEDALRNAPSVSIQPGGHGSSSFAIRGYDVTQTSVDGVTNFESRNNLTTPSANIDGIQRIEVIKGPNSVMAGSSSPGGSINLVRKAPVREPLHQLKADAIDNNHAEYKLALDLGGPLSRDKSWAYRFNISGMKSDNTWYDYDGGHSFFVAPVIGWRGDGTRFKVGGQFSKSRSSEGLSATYYDFAEGAVQDIPRLRFGDRDDHVSGDSSTIYYEFSQDLAPGWTFNSKATYLDSMVDIRLHEAWAIEPNGDIVAHPFSSRIDLSSISTQNDIQGKFNTGPIHHKVQIAHSFMQADSSQFDLSTGPVFGHNVWRPDTLNYPAIPKAEQKSFTQLQIQKGWLLQDDASIFNDRLHLLFSGRYTTWDNRLNVLAGSGSASKFKKSKFVPNYGIAFNITPDMTAYFNLLNGFYGTMQVDTNQEPLPPSTSQSKEFGLKWALLDSKLTVTSDIFEIEQDNVPVQNTQTGEYISAQGRSSKGFELNIDGSPMPGWDVTFGYTYLSVKVSDTQPDVAPTRITGQPRHSVNLWTTYQLQHGLLAGLGGGFGVTAASQTTNGNNTAGYFKLPSWAQVDTSIFYRKKAWAVTLGVKNIFDSRLYNYTSVPDFVSVKEGRRAHLTVYYDF